MVSRRLASSESSLRTPGRKNVAATRSHSALNGCWPTAKDESRFSEAKFPTDDVGDPTVVNEEVGVWDMHVRPKVLHRLDRWTYPTSTKPSFAELELRFGRSGRERLEFHWKGKKAGAVAAVGRVRDYENLECPPPHIHTLDTMQQIAIPLWSTQNSVMKDNIMDAYGACSQ
jgi:hypothetical protein